MQEIAAHNSRRLAWLESHFEHWVVLCPRRHVERASQVRLRRQPFPCHAAHASRLGGAGGPMLGTRCRKEVLLEVLLGMPLVRLDIRQPVPAVNRQSSPDQMRTDHKHTAHAQTRCHTQTQADTRTHRGTQTQTCRHTHRHIDTGTHRHTRTHTDTHRHRHKHKHRHRHILPGGPSMDRSCA